MELEAEVSHLKEENMKLLQKQVNSSQSKCFLYCSFPRRNIGKAEKLA
jgi:hypothetical protein